MRVVGIALLLLLVATPGTAQSEAGAPRRAGTDGAAGVRMFLPQRWGIVGVTVVNPTDHPAEVLSAHSFAGDADLQFARQLWIPARARRTTWYPILPAANSGPGMSLPVQSLLIDRSRGPEVLLSSPGGALIHDELLPSQPNNDPVTGVIADPDDTQTAVLAQVARAVLRLSGRLPSLDLERLPPTEQSLDALDHVVVGSDRLAEAPAALCAVRRWLRGGGRMWVQLDQVSPATVSLLLGEDFPCTVVDHVGLTRWLLRTQRSANPEDEAIESSVLLDATGKLPVAAEPEAVEGRIDRFEPPVNMARVVVPGARPVHTIDGWPASFWRRAGRGWILFTTVGPRAWVSARAGAGPQRGADTGDVVAHVEADEPLRQLAFAFLKRKEGPLLDAQVFGPLLAGQVGHRVISRATVMTVLGTFCLTLGAAAWWLSRKNSIASLGWIGPAAALSAALLLILLGSWTHGQVPPTAAVAQLVEVTPAAEEVSVTGLLGLYTSEGTSGPLGAERGGIFLPDHVGQQGTTRRMVWTDLDRWHWENLALSPGLHLTPFEAHAPVSPLSCRVTFGPAGVRGTAALGPFHDPADAILAFPSGHHLAVRLTTHDSPLTTHQLEADSADQLPPGRYLATDLLTGEQQRRQAVYERLLDPQAQQRYPPRATLLTWTAPVDLGFAFLRQARWSGAALVAVPVEVERPAPGTGVLIPAGFLPYQGVLREDFAPLYDPKKGAWVSARTLPAKTMLRFQVPRELLPLQIDRATVSVDVSAPGRPLEILAGLGRDEVLATRVSPLGRLRIQIDRPEVLQPDAAGGIYLGIAVGDSGQAGGQTVAEWAINDLRLELAGRIPEE